MDTNLTDEQIVKAINKRVLEGATWKDIAKSLKTTRKTLYQARQTDKWAEAAQGVIRELKAEALPIAWNGLLEAAERRDVAACREILNRLESVVTQKADITTTSTGDAAAKLDAKLADLHSRQVLMHTVEGRQLNEDFADRLAELYEKNDRGELTVDESPVQAETVEEERRVKRELAGLVGEPVTDEEAAATLKELVNLSVLDNEES